jgi:hypothetical protein
MEHPTSIKFDMLPRCLDCGECYGDSLFLWLDDKLWELIGCRPDDFLCAHCTIDRLEKHRSYAFLIGGSGNHEIKRAGAKVSMTQNGAPQQTPVFPLGVIPTIADNS